MHSAENPIPVESFAPESGNGAVPVVLQYPYARLSESYITDGIEVTIVPASSHQDFIDTADGYLAERGLPLIGERIPVVGYGSNVSPYQLREKMGKYGRGVAPVAQVVPCESVNVEDSVVAWHGKPGQNGSTFAELYTGEDTKDRQTKMAVQYFTKEQLAVMHTSEGGTYRFMPMQVTTEDGERLLAYAYVASNSSVLREDGKVVEVAFEPEGKALGKMTAIQAVAYMLRLAGSAIEIDDPIKLVEANTGASLVVKKQRQGAVAGALGKLGASTRFSYPGADERYIGRAYFGTITCDGGKPPQPLHLLEEHLATMRPSTAEVALRAQQVLTQDTTGKKTPETALRQARRELDVVADPVMGLRKRATDEIAARAGSGREGEPAAVLGPGEWPDSNIRVAPDGSAWKRIPLSNGWCRIEKVHE